MIVLVTSACSIIKISDEMPSLSVAGSNLASVCFPGPTGICAECSRNTILSLATPSWSRQCNCSVHHPRGIEGAIDQVHIHAIKS